MSDRMSARERRKHERLAVLKDYMDALCTYPMVREDNAQLIKHMLLDRWSRGFDEHVGEDGVREFEVIPGWDILTEVMEEAADIFIYSTEIANDMEVDERIAMALENVAEVALTVLDSLVELKRERE